MIFANSKYYYDAYLFEKLLTKEQIEEIKKHERAPHILFQKLRNFIVSKSINDRYREYFKEKHNRSNIFLKDLGIDEAVFNTIKEEQKFHAKMLQISNLISIDGFEKLNKLIERGILQKVGEVYTEASKYLAFQKKIKTNKSNLEKAVAEGILKSIPEANKIFDDFDMIPFYHHAKIFHIKDYLNDDNTKNIKQILKDIISFLPNNEIFGEVTVETRDDGRDIYYYIERDLMITIEANGIPYSLRSVINTKNYHNSYHKDFNPKNRIWKVSQILDIFNKIYREIGSDYRLYLISDLPNNYNNLDSKNSKVAVLVGKKGTNVMLRQEGIGFLGFRQHNNTETEANFLEKDFSAFLEKIKGVGLLDLYSTEEIDHVNHLGKTKFLYAPEKMMWLFDYFVMAICPRENDSYKNFIELVPKLTHGKVLLENFEEDFANGKLSFMLNGKAYSTSNLLKNRFDPFFIFLVNEAMGDQGLGEFYLWANEFDPHEQFSVIYSTPEIMKKAYTLKYPRFLELSSETIGHWRE